MSRDDADWCLPASAPPPTLIARLLIWSPNIYQPANSAKVWPVKKIGDKMTIIPCLRLARQKGPALQSVKRSGKCKPLPNDFRVSCFPVSSAFPVKIDSGDQYSVYTGACTNLQQLLLGFSSVYTPRVFSERPPPNWVMRGRVWKIFFKFGILFSAYSLLIMCEFTYLRIISPTGALPPTLFIIIVNRFEGWWLEIDTRRLNSDCGLYKISEN